MFEEFFENLRKEAEELGVKVNFSRENIRDEKHLNCFWYGGAVGSIEYRGCKIVIGAYGDIRADGQYDGKRFFHCDLEDRGEAFDEFGGIFDDDFLVDGIPGDDDDYLSLENNNRFEVDVIDASGNFVDLSFTNNVLPDNILECFTGIEDYLRLLDEVADRLTTAS